MKISAKSMTFTALLAAVICVLGPVSVPIGPVSISLGSLGVYIASCLLGKKYGVAAVLVYVALGAVGLPVFTNAQGGVDKIIGPTGGYIIGYLPCALIAGVVVDRLEKHVWAYPVGLAAGTAVLYAFGTAWYMIQSGVALVPALLVCVLPFLPLDAVKIVAATALCFKLRFLLRKVITRPRKKKEKAPREENPADVDENNVI